MTKKRSRDNLAVLKILNVLMTANRPLTTIEIAARAECSWQSVRNQLANIEACGFPIIETYNGSGKGNNPHRYEWDGRVLMWI